MNYYEELALPPSASTQEIRQAYRNLVRLLHPDQHQDEKLRALTESQMKRLNEVVSVLTDPVRRREYDASLGTKVDPSVAIVPRAPAPKPYDILPLLHPGNLVWVLIAVIGGVSVLFYLGTSGGQNPVRKIQATPAKAPFVKPEPQPASTPPHVLLETSKPSADQVPRPEPAFEPPPVLTRSDPWAAPRQTDAVPALPAPKANAEPEKTIDPAKPVADPANTFAGNWFYAPSQEPTPSKDLYPPEYIELRIKETAGLMQGHYRARYRLTDRPVSPEVVFQFEGPVSSKLANLHWAAPTGGAKGEVQLKLLSPRSMEVNWWATELDENLGFVSGTAVLLRQQEP